ncbi:MAG: 3-hydroxybutyrate dehydrogenase [Chitinophagaceae bacterium]|nr:3-hydroxybutyrate dehydrogenase [Chitinophagaceae bacterium]
MESKVVIITGGAGGLGKSMVQCFAANGYRVIVLDIQPLTIEQTTEYANGYAVSSFACDVTREAQVENIVDTVVQQFGRMDVLVNNAGTQHVAPVELFPTEKFQSMLDLMLVAPFIAIKHVLPVMKRQQFGRIINMASVNGLIGFAGKAAYNSAKHGLIGLTKVTALETATDGITVNAVCPGYVDTDLVQNQLAEIAGMRGITEEEVLEQIIFPLVPQKRLLQPNEIANLVLFLSGEKAGGITGQAIVIDGGYTTQ